MGFGKVVVKDGYEILRVFDWLVGWLGEGLGSGCSRCTCQSAALRGGRTEAPPAVSLLSGMFALVSLVAATKMAVTQSYAWGATSLNPYTNN